MINDNKPKPKDNFGFVEDLRQAIRNNGIDGQLKILDIALADLIAGLLSEPSFVNHFRLAITFNDRKMNVVSEASDELLSGKRVNNE